MPKHFKGANIKIYIGIDVASQKYDYYMVSEEGEIYTHRSITISNIDEVYKKLHKFLPH